VNRHAVKRVLEQVADTRLPVLPATRTRMRELARDPRVSMAAMGEAALHDVGFSVALIRAANNIPRRRAAIDLVTLEQAVMMLGVERAAGIADELDPLDSMPGVVAAPMRRLYARAYLTALIARDWAARRRDMAPDEVALAALVYNLGGLIATLHAPRAMAALAQLKARAGVWPHEAEYLALGYNLEPLGYALAERWALPTLAIESMKAYFANESRTLGVMLSAQLAYHAAYGWTLPALGADAAQATEYLKCSLPALAESLDGVVERYNAAAEDYGQPSLPRLEALPEPGSVPVRGLSFCLAPRPALVASYAAEGGETETEILDGLVHTLHEGVALNRVVFARFHPDQNSLIAEALAGTDYEPGFSRFRLRLTGGHLFERMVRQPGFFWARASEKTLWSQMPLEVVRLIKVESFFAASLYIDQTLLGVVYADRRHTDAALDERAYLGFKRVTALAVARLKRLRTA
jgi:HD-like signal output (HDOD) protein